MKSIIKPGYQERLGVSNKQFYCTHCGCVFKATLPDYNVISLYGKDYLYSECPTCGRDAYEDNQ